MSAGYMQNQFQISHNFYQRTGLLSRERIFYSNNQNGMLINNEDAPKSMIFKGKGGANVIGNIGSTANGNIEMYNRTGIQGETVNMGDSSGHIKLFGSGVIANTGNAHGSGGGFVELNGDKTDDIIYQQLGSARKNYIRGNGGEDIAIINTTSQQTNTKTYVKDGSSTEHLAFESDPRAEVIVKNRGLLRRMLGQSKHHIVVKNPGGVRHDIYADGGLKSLTNNGEDLFQQRKNGFHNLFGLI